MKSEVEKIQAIYRKPVFTEPSAHLTMFRKFAADYRAKFPAASMNEVQHAYQLAMNASAR